MPHYPDKDGYRALANAIRKAYTLTEATALLADYVANPPPSGPSSTDRHQLKGELYSILWASFGGKSNVESADRAVAELEALLTKRELAYKIDAKRNLIDDLEEAIIMPGRKNDWLRAWLEDEKRELADLTKGEE